MPGHLAIGPQQPSYVATALQVPCPIPYPPMRPYSTPPPFPPQRPPFMPPQPTQPWNQNASTSQKRTISNFERKPEHFDPIPMTYSELLP